MQVPTEARTLDPLKYKLWVIVSHPRWVWGIKPESSGTTLWAPKY